jgi:hypothetical protein
MLLWLAGGLVFAALFNWTLNARTVLLYAAPAALVFGWQTEGRRRLRAVTLAATALVGFGVVAADAELAGFGPAEVARLRAEFPQAGRLRFVGHWGFQGYMERAGYHHVDLERPDARPGDVVAIPEMHRVASASFAALPPSVTPAQFLERPRRLPWAVMSGRAGAGLHGSFLGHLPFAFTDEPLERVEVRFW